MLKAEYSRKINQSSLMITPEKEYETEKDSIEMFRYQQIPDFLKMKVQKKNTNEQFCYDITSKRSLEQILEYKSLDYILLLKILSSFDGACMQTEDFMMTENDILLEPEFVFLDHNLEQMSYCYVPGNQSDICLQFKGFMGYLLQHLDHKDKQAVQLAYYVYQRVVEERTALHDVLQEERFHQFLQEAGTTQFVKGADIRQFQQPDGSYTGDGCQQPEGKYVEDGCQRFEADPAMHTGIHPAKMMEETQWQSVYGIDEKDQSMGIKHIDDTNMQHVRDEQVRVDLRQQYTGNPWIQQEAVLEADNRQIKYRPAKKQKKEKSVKRKRLEQQEQGKTTAQFQSLDTESKIQQKETIRKQAAEKLKNMLRKKIYTDHSRFPEEDTVFEADAEGEEPPHSNPTVCLMPEDAGIQNRFVYQGPDRSRDFHCRNGKMILGSDLSECDIYIPVPMISRVHARIEINVQGAFLEDLNSTNGTHVNGELLQFHERHLLQKGDIISLAGECYSFH